MFKFDVETIFENEGEGESKGIMEILYLQCQNGQSHQIPYHEPEETLTRKGYHPSCQVFWLHPRDGT